MPDITLHKSRAEAGFFNLLFIFLLQLKDLKGLI